MEPVFGYHEGGEETTSGPDRVPVILSGVKREIIPKELRMCAALVKRLAKTEVIKVGTVSRARSYVLLPNYAADL